MACLRHFCRSVRGNSCVPSSDILNFENVENYCTFRISYKISTENQEKHLNQIDHLLKKTVVYKALNISQILILKKRSSGIRSIN